MNNTDQVLQYRQDYVALGSWDLVGQKHGLPGRVVQKAWYNAHHRHGIDDPAESIKVDNVIPLVTPETDHEQWNKVLATLPDVYRVAFVSDFHIPEQDSRAIELALKITADFNPHILANGGDAFDFSTIGRWEVDPDDITTDVWQQINRPYLQIMRAFKSAAPDAANVFIVGNHDERVYKFLTRQAPQFRYTVNQLFTDMIRKSGFMWLGWEATELQLPGLLLAHGTGIVAGVYPARRLADYTYGQTSALAGHVHRFDTWTRRGSHSTVTFQTSGCLCVLQPKWSNRRENWQNGITLVTVVNGIAHMEAVPFLDYRAVFGGREYRA